MDYVKKVSEYYDTNVEAYVKKRNKGQTPDFLRLRKKFAEEIGSGKVLDAGCGHGIHSKYFCDKGVEIVGVDVSESLLRIARENAPKAEFHKMDIRELSFDDNSFDGVWACACLLHLKKSDCKKALREFRRVLKADGLFYSCVKKGDGESSRRERYVKYYQPGEFKELVESQGFKILELVVNRQYDKEVDWINVFARKD